MKFPAALLICAVFAVSLAACQTPRQRETPIGHACYRQFDYEVHPRWYGCLFELSAPSAFYDDKEIEKILNAFMSEEGGKCAKQPERDVADVRTQDWNHGLRYRLFVIKCD